VEHLRTAGFTVLVPQPIQVKAFGRVHLRRAKNDALDAVLIAACAAALDQPRIALDPRLAELAGYLTFLEQAEEVRRRPTPGPDILGRRGCQDNGACVLQCRFRQRHQSRGRIARQGIRWTDPHPQGTAGERRAQRHELPALLIAVWSGKTGWKNYLLPKSCRRPVLKR
jgi:hypothetical protein